MSSTNLLGSFTPTCDSEGFYEMKQCHPSTGQCWCVHKRTGMEISNTRRNNSEVATCGKVNVFPWCKVRTRLGYSQCQIGNDIF